MKPTSFLIQLGRLENRLSSTYSAYSDQHCSLYIRANNDNHIQYICKDEGFIVYIGEVTKKRLSENSEKRPGQGTLITYTKTSGKIVVETDRLGTAILYYGRTKNNKLEISNRLDNLEFDKEQINWPAIQQYLNTGYTIGSNTFFYNVEQTLPNEKLTACSTDNFQINRSVIETPGSFDNQTEEQLVDLLSARLSSTLDERSSSVLMMSAGWDSRTLLMAGPEHYHSAYTHGDLSSREISISHRLTSDLRMDHIFSDIQNLELSEDLLDTMLEELGFCIFPVWYIAGQRAQKIYNSPLSSGVLGELLGGHYGLLSMGSRLQKVLAAASLLPGKLIPDDQFSTALERFTTPAASHWFLSEEGHNLLSNHAETTKTMMRNRLNTAYGDTGDWQSAIETFNMEHRARQYIFKQALAASSTSGYLAPFADDTLADIVRSIPFDYRVHNKLNKKILKEKNPKLLNHSMAATLVPAKYPILFQEFSRGVRILLENGRKILKKSQPRLGWFNYEHLYQTKILQEIIESLSLDLWDKQKMLKTIEKNPENGIDAGSTLDMLCKLKTIDYYLNNNRKGVIDVQENEG
ncbi:hypothetical protein [Marinobacter sp. F3R11]|uniref:hypothetical protein n=1 Tax=Marinobacter sp. F3R11 TaxID=2267231 RepID=UPI000DE83D73|nr:hypothetical protein [Marinobacter sp. F3R11]RBW49717.1 hypothetical protein DS878_05075 [Marinobacter sp. F3R11]